MAPRLGRGHDPAGASGYNTPKDPKQIASSSALWANGPEDEAVLDSQTGSPATVGAGLTKSGKGYRVFKSVVGACVIALALGGCAVGSSPPGEVLEFRLADVPTCVERQGEVCLDHMAQFQLTGESNEVTFESGPGGSFATTVPAGEYELNVLNDDRCVTPNRLTIREGAPHRFDILWPSAC